MANHLHFSDPAQRAGNTALALRSRTPDISIPSRDRFAQSLARFEKELSNVGREKAVRFKVLRTAKIPDLTEAVRVTEEISNDCALRHEGWREYALRIMPFLNRIRELAPIGDVVVRGAQNLAVSGVWAAVRLSIEASLSFLAFFDKVSLLLF